VFFACSREFASRRPYTPLGMMVANNAPNMDKRTAFFLTLMLSACGHSPRLEQAMPAPPDSAQARTWKTITVNGSLGSMTMPVPVVTVGTDVIVDTVALNEMEKRLTGRVASIAREQAEALVAERSNVKAAESTSQETNLLGTITFGADSIQPGSEAITRIKAIGGLAEKLPGSVELRATAEGTGAAVFDVAIARARRVYFSLLESNPALAQRPMRLTVSTISMEIGAPRAQPSVAIYILPE